MASTKTLTQGAPLKRQHKEAKKQPLSWAHQWEADLGHSTQVSVEIPLLTQNLCVCSAITSLPRQLPKAGISLFFHIPFEIMVTPKPLSFFLL